MHLATGRARVFLEASQVESVVVIGEKTRLPVVAALNDSIGTFGNVNRARRGMRAPESEWDMAK